jgi:hypothetical protein
MASQRAKCSCPCLLRCARWLRAQVEGRPQDSLFWRQLLAGYLAPELLLLDAAMLGQRLLRASAVAAVTANRNSFATGNLAQCDVEVRGCPVTFFF